MWALCWLQDSALYDKNLLVCSSSCDEDISSHYRLIFWGVQLSMLLLNWPSITFDFRAFCYHYLSLLSQFAYSQVWIIFYLSDWILGQREGSVCDCFTRWKNPNDLLHSWSCPRIYCWGQLPRRTSLSRGSSKTLQTNSLEDEYFVDIYYNLNWGIIKHIVLLLHSYTFLS